MEESKIFLKDYSFGRYDSIEYIGKGGTSKVVKARNKQEDKYYAIKMVNTGLDSVIWPTRPTPSNSCTTSTRKSCSTSS
jgi:serine/threonine protein kinase